MGLYQIMILILSKLFGTALTNICIWVGVENPDTSKAAGAIATGVVGTILILWDMLQHSKLYAAAMKDRQTLIDNDLPSANDKQSNSSLRITMLLVLLSVSTLFVGCVGPAVPLNQQDLAISRVRRGQEAYLVAATTLNVLHSDHKISDKTYNDILLVEAPVFAALQAAQTAAEKGQPIDANTQLDLFDKSLDALLKILAPYNAPVPATQPASLPVHNHRTVMVSV